MEGWFKVHRAMEHHRVWSLSANHRLIWIACLMHANAKDAEWFDGHETIQVPMGCFVTSQDHLAIHARVSRQSVRSGLKMLERIGSISTRVSTGRWTMIRVVNWPSYQSNGDASNQLPNLAPTNPQPGANQVPTTNKKERRKEGKKELDPSRVLSPDGDGPSQRALDFVALWNRHAAASKASGFEGMSQVKELTAGRERKIKLRLRDEPDLAWWDVTMGKLSASAFACGKTGWRASFDWLIRDDTNAVKAYEGGYDDGKEADRKRS